WPLVTRHEPFSEIAREIVVSRGGPRLDDAADGLRESLLHLQPWKRIDDFCYPRSRQRVVAPAAPVEGDARRTERHLRLLVQGNGRRGVEGDDIPDQLAAAIVEPGAPSEHPC